MFEIWKLLKIILKCEKLYLKCGTKHVTVGKASHSVRLEIRWKNRDSWIFDVVENNGF